MPEGDGFESDLPSLNSIERVISKWGKPVMKCREQIFKL
jgi:hypothetical protein